MKGSGPVKCATHLFSFSSLDLTPSSKSMLLSISRLSLNQPKKNYPRTRNRLVCAKMLFFRHNQFLTVTDQNVSGVDISSPL